MGIIIRVPKYDDLNSEEQHKTSGLDSCSWLWDSKYLFIILSQCKKSLDISNYGLVL